MVRPLALVALALLVTGDAASAPRTRCPGATGFAHLAYVRAGALLVLDMPACSGRMLVRRGAGPPVRWSADGRYVSFGGGVVSVDDRRIFRGLHGVWAPRGHTLAAVTGGGGVVLGDPGRPERRLLPDGFGARSLAFDATGTRIAVGRARPRRAGVLGNRELWLIDLRSGERRLVYRPDPADRRTPVVVRWAGRHFVIFRLAALPANSANLDGLPLHAVSALGGRDRRVVAATLAYDEFVSSCGSRLVVAAGADRFATQRKRLVVAGPPGWVARDLSRDAGRSWVSPACSPDGRVIAASAGRSRVGGRFGLERRSIWLLSLDGRERGSVFVPPSGLTDELPRWAATGAVFFIRTGPTTDTGKARGRLYLGSANGLAGPLADLGVTGNYYGRYGWAGQTDLFVPRVR